MMCKLVYTLVVFHYIILHQEPFTYILMNVGCGYSKCIVLLLFTYYRMIITDMGGFFMFKWSTFMLSASLLAVTASSSSVYAAEVERSSSVSSTVPSSYEAAAVQSSSYQGVENYHSVRFSIDFMDTIMAGGSEPRGRFYQALQEAIGARVIFYDFWSDHIIIKVIDKELTPEEAKVVKDKMNSLQWLHETYGVPMDQEIITDIYWFDRWA